MERLPRRPARLTIPPDSRVLPSGCRLWRVYFRGGAGPTAWNELRHFGPLGARFDHHTRPPRRQFRGILYAAVQGPKAILTALAETFQQGRVLDRRLREPWLVGFDLAAPVTLNSTCGLWPLQAGGGMTINSGSRARAREWSQRIYADYATIQGIYYPSSLTNEPAVALYERAVDSIPKVPVFHRALADPTILAGLTVLARQLGPSWTVK